MITLSGSVTLQGPSVSRANMCHPQHHAVWWDSRHMTNMGTSGCVRLAVTNNSTAGTFTLTAPPGTLPGVYLVCLERYQCPDENMIVSVPGCPRTRTSATHTDSSVPTPIPTCDPTPPPPGP